MRFDVFRKVIGAHEFFRTFGTRKPFFAGMCPSMTLQFVRSREFFATKDPTADERPLSCVPPQMSSQVTRFTVNFIASGYMTHVLPFSCHISVPKTKNII